VLLKSTLFLSPLYQAEIEYTVENAQEYGMKKRTFLMIGTLLLVSLACSFASRFLENGNPIPVASSQPTGEALPEVTQQPQLPSNVLFQDDFSNPSSGWDQFSDADGLTNYEDGVYRILVDTPEFTFWANPGLGNTLPSDVHVEVDATKVGGPDFNDFGVLCRYSGTGSSASFYEFIITSDGYAGIVRVTESSQDVISTDGQLQSFDAVTQGNTTNHIKAECFGSLLTLYVNDVLFTSVTDTTLTGGDVGLLASSYEEGGVDIHFDNFLVTVP
jgi:hypothetical protein